jgi:hypothetical protein
MIYACRQPRLAMNACMLQYQNQSELDKARAEWFQLAGERKAAREEHQRRLEDARSKHKEWWNLDENGQLKGKDGRKFGERSEENRIDGSGVTRGGIYRGTWRGEVEGWVNWVGRMAAGPEMNGDGKTKAWHDAWVDLKSLCINILVDIESWHHFW